MIRTNRPNTCAAASAPQQHKYWVSAGIIMLLVGWALVGSTQLEYVFPGPIITGQALWQLLHSGTLLPALGLTLIRAITGLGIGLSLGITWGALAGRFPQLHSFTSSWLQALLVLPPIVLVVLGMVWFGTSPLVVVFVVAAVTTPVLAAATRAGVSQLEPNLLEMAQLFGVRGCRLFWQVAVPGILPPVMAATTVALGQAVRVAVMAELFATTAGIGAGIRLAQINIETADIFAYALVMALVTGCLDWALIAPVRKRRERLGR